MRSAVRRRHDQHLDVPLNDRPLDVHLDDQQAAAEVCLRAKRRAGELLKPHPKNRGAASKRDTTPVLRLDEIGISANQSSRWQAIAAIGEPTIRLPTSYPKICIDGI